MSLINIKKDAEIRMNKSVEALRQDLTKLRTGRATTAIVDGRVGCRTGDRRIWA